MNAKENEKPLPSEVVKALDWYLSGKKPRRVAFFPKAEISRAAAWNKTALSEPHVSRIAQPWRKHHTENFWVWFIKDDVRTQDARDPQAGT